MPDNDRGSNQLATIAQMEESLDEFMKELVARLQAVRGLIAGANAILQLAKLVEPEADHANYCLEAATDQLLTLDERIAELFDTTPGIAKDTGD